MRSPGAFVRRRRLRQQRGRQPVHDPRQRLRAVNAQQPGHPQQLYGARHRARTDRVGQLGQDLRAQPLGDRRPLRTGERVPARQFQRAVAAPYRLRDQHRRERGGHRCRAAALQGAEQPSRGVEFGRRTVVDAGGGDGLHQLSRAPGVQRVGPIGGPPGRRRTPVRPERDPRAECGHGQRPGGERLPGQLPRFPEQLRRPAPPNSGRRGRPHVPGAARRGRARALVHPQARRSCRPRVLGPHPHHPRRRTPRPPGVRRERQPLRALPRQGDRREPQPPGHVRALPLHQHHRPPAGRLRVARPAQIRQHGREPGAARDGEVVEALGDRRRTRRQRQGVRYRTTGRGRHPVRRPPRLDRQPVARQRNPRRQVHRVRVEPDARPRADRVPYRGRTRHQPAAVGQGEIPERLRQRAQFAVGGPLGNAAGKLVAHQGFDLRQQSPRHPGADRREPARRSLVPRRGGGVVHLCKAHLSALFVLPRPIPVPTPYGWVGGDVRSRGGDVIKDGAGVPTLRQALPRGPRYYVDGTTPRRTSAERGGRRRSPAVAPRMFRRGNSPSSAPVGHARRTYDRRGVEEERGNAVTCHVPLRGPGTDCPWLW